MKTLLLNVPRNNILFPKNKTSSACNKERPDLEASGNKNNSNTFETKAFRKKIILKGTGQKVILCTGPRISLLKVS
jgi:hypothetical protein